MIQTFVLYLVGAWNRNFAMVAKFLTTLSLLYASTRFCFILTNNGTATIDLEDQG